MSVFTYSKLAFLVKCFNAIFYRRKIVILIGANGITIANLKWHRIEETIFIAYNDKNFKKIYRKYLKKHKKYYITFLLDNKECIIKHEIMPILSSLLKSNPINKFIAENYQPSDIVAYNIYEVSNSQGEIWNSCIASTPFCEPVSDLIKYIITNSFKYNGIYFLSLEFQTIIDKLLKQTNNIKCNDHLQIFVTITKSSDIKLIVKYKQNIMSVLTIEYPQGKSLMYVVGTIEQAVLDKLQLYKGYIDKLNLPTCVIFLGNKKLKDLINNLSFENSTIVSIAKEEVFKYSNSNLKITQDVFQDDVLIEKFNNYKTHLALNKYLKAITELTLVNNVIFKPFIVMLIGLFLILITLKYKTITIQAETNKINQKYYSLSKDYREVQSRHPDLKNINDLVDLYNLELMIKNTSITGFEHLKYIIPSTDYSNIEITKIIWDINDPQSINLLNKKFNISVDLIYKIDSKANIDNFNAIGEYANRLKYVFPDYEVIYKEEDVITNKIVKNIITSANINIIGETKSGSHAK